MAHVTVEWTDNLHGVFEIKPLLALIAEDMRNNADGVFPVGGIRVRGVRVTDYVIADGENADDAFINLSVLMGAGRSSEFRKSYFDHLFSRITKHLGDLFEKRPLALSLYCTEAEGWKQNSIHQRLRKN